MVTDILFCPSAIRHIFLFMKFGNFCLSRRGVFLCWCFFFSPLWFEKHEDDHDNDYLFVFFTFSVLLLSFMPAASICVTMLLLFQTCIIKKKEKKD